MNEQLITIGDHKISLDLEDDDIITDTIVLARVVRFDTPGESTLIIGASDNTDHIVQAGMLTCAADISVRGDE